MGGNKPVILPMVLLLQLNMDYYVVQIITALIINSKLEYGLFNGQPIDNYILNLVRNLAQTVFSDKCVSTIFLSSIWP